jgi:hypothetical protein
MFASVIPARHWRAPISPSPVNCPATAIEVSSLGYRYGHAISGVLVSGRADAYQ